MLGPAARCFPVCVATRLIAFRSEYQITVEPIRNRLFYKHYAELTHTAALPDYLPDWEQALEVVRPGFTILSDMTDLPTVSDQRAGLIGQAQLLVMRRGVRLVAAVHAPGSETYHARNTVREESSRPIRTFTDRWGADKFLDVWWPKGTRKALGTARNPHHSASSNPIPNRPRRPPHNPCARFNAAV